MRGVRPANPGEPAVWTMTVTVEEVPPERFFEIPDHLEQLLAGVEGLLAAAGLGRVTTFSVAGACC